jgi:hypothetical protein
MLKVDKISRQKGIFEKEPILLNFKYFPSIKMHKIEIF